MAFFTARFGLVATCGKSGVFPEKDGKICEVLWFSGWCGYGFSMIFFEIFKPPMNFGRNIPEILHHFCAEHLPPCFFGSTLWRSFCAATPHLTAATSGSMKRVACTRKRRRPNSAWTRKERHPWDGGNQRFLVWVNHPILGQWRFGSLPVTLMTSTWKPAWFS